MDFDLAGADLRQDVDLSEEPQERGPVFVEFLKWGQARVSQETRQETC